MPRDCPICGLANPDSTAACDCGYSFDAGTGGRVQVNAAARRNMLIAGCLVTTITLAVLAAVAIKWAEGMLLSGLAR